MATTETKKARREVTKKALFDRDGNETKDYRKAHTFQLEIIGADTIRVSPADEFSAEVQNAAMIFGTNLVLTNTLGGMAAEDAWEAAQGRLETLLSGEWADRKGGSGPRLSLLSEAIVAVFAAKGQTKEVGAIKEKLLGMSPEAREKWASEPNVKAEMERIKAEAAAKRAQAAREAAEAAGQTEAPDDEDAFADAFGEE